MKITFYNAGDKDGELIKKFLLENEILFKEVITNDLNLLQKIAHSTIQRKVSLIEIRNGYVKVITGFLEWDLNQLLEHIKKYKPKLK